MGQYDIVTIAEGSNDALNALALSVGRLGNVRTQTCPPWSSRQWSGCWRKSPSSEGVGHAAARKAPLLRPPTIAAIDLFIAKKIIAALVLPPTGPLLVALIGLALLARRPKLGAALAWVGVLSLLALSLPSVWGALLHSLDQRGALDLAQAREAQAIVILGGGIRRDASEYGGDTLGR